MTTSLLISYVLLGCFQNSQNSFSDCNEIQTHNHLDRKRTLNYLVKLVVGLSQTHKQLKKKVFRDKPDWSILLVSSYILQRMKILKIIVHTAFAFEG